MKWTAFITCFLWLAWKCFLLPKVPFLVFLEFALEQTWHFPTGSLEKAESDWKRWGQISIFHLYAWVPSMGMFNSVEFCFNSYRLYNIKFFSADYICPTLIQYSPAMTDPWQIEPKEWLGTCQKFQWNSSKCILNRMHFLTIFFCLVNACEVALSMFMPPGFSTHHSHN